MKAMVLTLAAGIGESAFARWWWKAGRLLDCLIPILLVATIVTSFGITVVGLIN